MGAGGVAAGGSADEGGEAEAVIDPTGASNPESPDRRGGVQAIRRVAAEIV